MIIIDSRAGSQDLYQLLKDKGVPVEMGRLDFGDAAFIGSGPNGSVSIGIEYKKIGDALACMTGGRFAGHQLPGLMQTYGQYWLLVEGVVRASDEGSLQVFHNQRFPNWLDYRQGNRFVMWRYYQHWLTSLQVQGGCKLAQTTTPTESVAWIAALYSWWQKPWLEHKSVQTIYTGEGVKSDSGIFSSAIQSSVSLRRLWAMQLPGIGTDKSKAVEAAFPTALDMAQAGPSAWTEIDGIGKTLACKVWSAIREK